MHNHQWNNLEPTIREMSDADKLDLIEKLIHSLRSPKNGHMDVSVVERQRQTFQELQQRIASHALGDDPYADLGCSDAAHDKILYDLRQK